MGQGDYRPSFWMEVLFAVLGIAVVYLSFRLMCGPHGCDFSQFPRDVYH